MLPPTNVHAQGPQTPAPQGVAGGGGSRGSGALDVVTVSGGLSRHWRLPDMLRRLGEASGGQQRSVAGDEEKAAGSVSSYLDVKTGCLLEGGMSPRPFTQEVCVCVCVLWRIVRGVCLLC